MSQIDGTNLASNSDASSKRGRRRTSGSSFGSPSEPSTKKPKKNSPFAQFFNRIRKYPGEWPMKMYESKNDFRFEDEASTKAVYLLPDWKLTLQYKNEPKIIIKDCQSLTEEKLEYFLDKVVQSNNISELCFGEAPDGFPTFSPGQIDACMHNINPNSTDNQGIEMKERFKWLGGTDPNTDWLNVFLYMKLLGEHSKSNDVFVMDCSFDTDEVISKLEQRDWFEYEVVLIPIYENEHWKLVVFHVCDGKIVCYDFGKSNNNVLNTLRRYVEEFTYRIEKKYKLLFTGTQEAIKFKKNWVTEDVEHIPWMDGFHNGFIMCIHADFIIRKLTIAFSQQHLPYFRMKMVYEIITRKIVD